MGTPPRVYNNGIQAAVPALKKTSSAKHKHAATTRFMML